MPATAEALEALGVPVVGVGTHELPAFYSGSSGIALEHSVDAPEALAPLLRLHWDELQRHGGVLAVVPPPHALPRAAVEAAIESALAEARARKLGGKETTPFLLGRVAAATGGAAIEANLALLENNARVAGRIAAGLSAWK